MKSLGLYIHIPFCVKKCHYCDFYSISHLSSKEREYINALCSHMRSEAHIYKDYEIDTVFFGGGTPSVLSCESFSAIANTIKECFNLSKSLEFTVEANPGTLDREKLLTYKRAGVNRLSIGLQSANEQELHTLGRIHSLSVFEQGYALARECGFNNISVDVMYGLPNQKIEDFAKTLDHVCDLKPEHISAYCLKIEENTPFGKMKDTLCLPGEDEEYEMYMLLCDKLKSFGYEQYEISNFAQKGFHSRHNMKYWLSQEYISYGPASHSYFGGVRYSYCRSIDKYMEKPTKEYEVENCERRVAKIDEMDEYVMLKLRLSQGVDEQEFYERFSATFIQEYPQIEEFVKSGYMEHKNGAYCMNSRGFFVSNYILTEILHF